MLGAGSQDTQIEADAGMLYVEASIGWVRTEAERSAVRMVMTMVVEVGCYTVHGLFSGTGTRMGLDWIGLGLSSAKGRT